MHRTSRVENVEVRDENGNFVFIRRQRNFEKKRGFDDLRERLSAYFTQDGERLNETENGYETPDGKRYFIKVE